MADTPQRIERPSAARVFIAAAVVLLTIGTVWKVIDYRTQPPPPPNPVGASPTPSR